MSTYVFKLPDLGEGTVEAELVEWHVKPGDTVSEDDVIADVMTDKASVEIPSPVSGKIVRLAGQAGDMIPVGSELVVFETGAGENTSEPTTPTEEAAPIPAPAGLAAAGTPPEPQDTGATVTALATGRRTQSERRAAPEPAAQYRNPKPATSPAIRRMAREAGVDLRDVPGTGPRGRIQRSDFEAYLGGAGGAAAVPLVPRARHGAEEIKVIGLRRLIAQRLSESKRNIPHFAYVEEVDVTELEMLRAHLNARAGANEPALTYLPFLGLALVKALGEFPQCNATYDAERGVIVRHRPVHLGVATQSPDGLKVPVVRHAEAMDLWQLAREIGRVSQAARDGNARKDELTGSTITITSLGKLGGIVSTPVINAPEVAIIGVNRAVERPMVVNGAIAVRRMMNLSSSFDHRFVDGYDAAAMIQRVKELIEHPATIFMNHAPH